MTFSRRSFGVALAALATLSCWHAPSWAQDFPNRPIRLVVPVSAGSGTDATARFVANALGKVWGVTVVVENKAGAGVIVGTDFVAKAPADGYTLLFTYAAHYSQQWTMATPFDAVRDFEPVARLATSTLILATRADSPLRTPRDVIEAAKQKPGVVTYGSAGIGTTGHMAGALLENMTGTQFNHVPYKSASQVPVDAVSGQVDVMMGGLASSLPLVRSGRLRVLAVTAANRSASLPDVPTLAESGVPGYENSSPIWVFAPRGTPAPIVQKLSDALRQVAATPEFKEYCITQGIDVDIQDAATVRASATAESAKWRKLVELTTPANK
jgi:tripartite-type tricarboxylate transporter receptor subunit TctC